jgi:hypothetical protein
VPDITTAQDAKDAGYLCGECAEGAGGVWPKGHVATFHTGTCPLCHTPNAGLACWDDWAWPGSDLDAEVSYTREP